MKKSSKRFVISSEAKNDKGFRVRTAGIKLDQYNSNPLLLWMHKRPKGLSKNEVLPIGNVLELSVEGKKLMGTPAFDDTDDFAVTLSKKVENQTLRMMSAGLYPPYTWSKDAAGEVWLEESTLKEISLADIGSNAEALAVTLYNESDEVINLSLEQITENLKPDNKMKSIQLQAATLLPMLNLTAEATPDEVAEEIGKFVTLTATQKDEIVNLTSERDDFKTKYEAEVKLATEAKIVALVDGAVDARKILAGEKDKYVKLANADFETTKSVIDGMQASKPVKDQLIDGKTGEDLTKLSWQELEAANKLVTLKANDLPLFKEKFKEEFGTEYKDKQ